MIDDLDHAAPENPDLGALRFMVSDYFATGEGRTVSILITTLAPRRGDGGEWESEPGWDFGTPDRPGGYVPGKLKHTPRQVLARQFRSEFGEWYARGLEILDWQEMKARFGAYLPELVVAQIEARNCVLHFRTQLHLNFS